MSWYIHPLSIKHSSWTWLFYNGVFSHYKWLMTIFSSIFNSKLWQSSQKVPLKAHEFGPRAQLPQLPQLQRSRFHHQVANRDQGDALHAHHASRRCPGREISGFYALQNGKELGLDIFYPWNRTFEFDRTHHVESCMKCHERLHEVIHQRFWDDIYRCISYLGHQIMQVPSGNLSHSCWKWSFVMGKHTIGKK